MLTRNDILLGMVLPAGVAAGVLLVAWSISGRWPRRCDWAGPVAVAGGFAAGMLGIIGWPGVPPRDSTEWLLFAAAALGMLGVIEALWRVPPWMYRIVAAAVAGVFVWLLLRPMTVHTWSGAEATGWIAGVGGAVLLGWLGMRHLAGRAEPLAMAAGLLIACGGAFLVMMLSASLKLGQFGAALMAAVAGAMVVGWLSGWRCGWRPAAGVVMVLLAGVLIGGHFYAMLTPWNAMLVFLAPLMIWAGELPGVRNLAARKRTALRIAAAATPVAIALVLAYIDFAMAMGDPYHGYDGYDY